MRTVTFLQPKRLVFGQGCVSECIEYVAGLKSRHVHIVTSRSLTTVVQAIADALTKTGCVVTVDANTSPEPTFTHLEEALQRVRGTAAQCVLGIGGGSVLDVAKLLAAFVKNSQRIEEAVGIGLLSGRDCSLVCMPTTSGTGSEVSPNAILLDEVAKLKKGIISPYLVPDATFIDPVLTHTMPAAITASTGLDALTHCIEAYTNKFAHPLVDLYALKGIEACARYLVRSVKDGDDLEAREGMSLASLYGGLCLGPVNTAANHALAYPLGGEFHMAHGLSNAVLLTAVYRFNAAAVPERYAEVARALGVGDVDDDMAMAELGAKKLSELVSACGVAIDLAAYGVPLDAIDGLAASAMTVTRLLKNNPRDITHADAVSIYRECYSN